MNWKHLKSFKKIVMTEYDRQRIIYYVRRIENARTKFDIKLKGKPELDGLKDCADCMWSAVQGLYRLIKKLQTNEIQNKL
ncbi:hypothetical protein [Microvirus D_HF4_274]|nr:hypothetical protein [Microvirus D_HF4_274]